MARPESGRQGRRLLPLILAILALGGAVASGLFAAPPRSEDEKKPKPSSAKKGATIKRVSHTEPAAASKETPKGPWYPSKAGGPPAIDKRLSSPKSLEQLLLTSPNEPFPMPEELKSIDLMKQTKAEADAKSAGCVNCHAGVKDMHFKDTMHIGCTDCHGGDAQCEFPAPGSTRYCPAAPPAKNPRAWRSSANPVRSYALLNHESPDFIRFVNPGDLRISHISCGTTNCHPKENLQIKKCMMTNGCMLWGAALYNNGSVKDKVARYGELYSMSGKPLRLQTVPPPSEWEKKHRAIASFLDPLPRYEISQPGNTLRIFERGGKIRTELGIPEKAEDPGRPFTTRLSDRGFGTQNRTDPVLIGLQKTRLFDPTLNFIGTNDHAGDYRQSGCTACHVIYANDRSPVHSGPYAKFGNKGMASKEPFQGATPDPMIPKDERGHPIVHRFAKGNSIPTSQCMICHIHPGTTVMNSYVGMMWWDLESDGDLMYPAEPKKLTTQEFIQKELEDPMELSARGNFSDNEFLDSLWEKNLELKHNQFADFHGHGWVFRAVFKHDQKGNLIDYFGNKVTDQSAANLKRGVDFPIEMKELYRNWDKKTPEQRKKQEKELMEKRHGSAMHLLDIHMEKGMHCVDCHFVQDNHGNTRLQTEVRAAVEIQCIDCHGTVRNEATLRTSGPAAYTSTPGRPDLGRDLKAMRTPNGKARFEKRGGKIYQNSMVEENLTWEVVQVKDTIDPNHEHYNSKSSLAKTVRHDGEKLIWGNLPPKKDGQADDHGCAHANDNMTCITCHSSWNPTCYGCHLPQKANVKAPQLHNEGDVTRNLTTYNWQTLRDDVFMLARDGNATRNRINPSRSSCAVHVSSYNNNRELIYSQQQTISAEGFSGIAFSTNVPHTVSGKGTTKQCTSCHISKDDDNNAQMAQLLMHGTGALNFMGRMCWVGAGEHGIMAPIVSERPEPQSVIGSTMHRNAYPEEYEKHQKNGRMLKEFREHPGKDILDNVTHPFRKVNVTALQARGEYLYAACGEGGIRLFDISMNEHKGFAEKIFTAPASPAGQRLFIPTKYCTSLASPTTIAPDPTRAHYPENDEKNRVAGLYAYIYATDKYEGLITVQVATLLDGNPLNNFLKRAVTFNPGGLLCGARAITIIGTYGYICCDAGVVVVQLANPEKPEVKAVIGKKYLKHPTCVSAQFRYCFIADKEDIKVFDITELDNPKPVAKIKVPHVHSIYLARTYAYCAAGEKGLVILDIENPENPKVDQIFNADGCINDCHDVKLGIYYNSQFAFVADGKNGMRVVQLSSPDTPGNSGFSPRPTPELIATFKVPNGGHAHTIGRAMDRDRAVDESGNQLAVFCRVGARPMNLDEQKKMYLRNGKVWKVSDSPTDPLYHKLKWVEPTNGNGGPKLP